MKLAIILVSALLSCLFFLSAQTSVAFAKSLSPTHCEEAELDGCVETGELANAAIPGSTSEFMRFSGAFTNTMVNVSGLITIALTINSDDTLEGNVNFSQFVAGEQKCGSGDFEGTKTGETIELHFTSDGVDPACGFFQGVTFTIEAALLNNTIIRGDYSTDTGEQGIVELKRIPAGGGVYMPLIRH